MSHFVTKFLATVSKGYSTHSNSTYLHLSLIALSYKKVELAHYKTYFHFEIPFID